MVEIKNYTSRLVRGEAFLREKCGRIRTDGLSIHIKFTRAKDCDLTGYYRFRDRRIVVAVRPRLRYPRLAAYGVGFADPSRRRSKVWHQERFDDADELLVFVAGHEIWHFLCHSRQRIGDLESLANCNGFLWLEEFKRWNTGGASVEPIPQRPPRPDLEHKARRQRRSTRRDRPREVRPRRVAAVGAKRRRRRDGYSTRHSG